LEVEMSEVKLAPCPVCGAETTIASDIDNEHFVVCLLQGGHGCGPTCSTEEEAARKWNKVAGLAALGPEILRALIMAAGVCEAPWPGVAEEVEKLGHKLEALGIGE
jgi:hypothetical protein